MKKRLWLSGSAAIAVGVAFLYCGPGGDGVIGHLTLDDGSEFRLVQRYNQSLIEPYTVDFYLKQPGAAWGWCYLEHEGTRWTSARMVAVPETQSVQIFRGSTLRAEYFTDRRTFALYGRNQRELPAPQELRNPPR